MASQALPCYSFLQLKPRYFSHICKHQCVYLVLFLSEVHEHFCVLILQLGMLGCQRAAALLQEAVALGQRQPQVLSFLLQTGMLYQ